MKSHPILFSAPMVRALLAGTKTQTRRLVKPQPESAFEGPVIYHPTVIRRGMEEPGGPVMGIYCPHGEWGTKCPYGQPGDQLWVRETWQAVRPWSVGYVLCEPDHPEAEIHFRATAEACVPELPWRPSIFMPRKASRITLEVTSIRVERLNDISPKDAEAEGVGSGLSGIGACYSYGQLWESIHGPGSWSANPLVWVVGFSQLQTKRATP